MSHLFWKQNIAFKLFFYIQSRVATRFLGGSGSGSRLKNDSHLGRDDSRPGRNDSRLGRDDGRLGCYDSRFDSHLGRDDGRLGRDDGRLGCAHSLSAFIVRTAGPYNDPYDMNMHWCSLPHDSL